MDRGWCRGWSGGGEAGQAGVEAVFEGVGVAGLRAMRAGGRRGRGWEHSDSKVG